MLKQAQSSHLEEFVQNINQSSLKKSKLMYITALLITVVELISIDAHHIPHIIDLLSFIGTIVMAGASIVTLTPQINHILHCSKGFTLPRNHLGEYLFLSLLVLFFVWLLGLSSSVAQFTDPHLVKSYTLQPTLTAAVQDFFQTPIEEIWRWTFLLSLFYLSTNWISIKRPIVLSVVIGVTCVVFGVGHLGELRGHELLIVGLLSLSGLFLFLAAYWSQSFWIAVIVHQTYDILINIPWIRTSHLWEWWPIAGVFWIAIGYISWRKNISKPTRMRR